MKPGNRHICEMVPSHSKRIALTDERMETYITIYTFCLSAYLQKGFFVIKSGKRR